VHFLGKFLCRQLVERLQAPSEHEEHVVGRQLVVQGENLLWLGREQLGELAGLVLQVDQGLHELDEDELESVVQSGDQDQLLALELVQDVLGLLGQVSHELEGERQGLLVGLLPEDVDQGVPTAGSLLKLAALRHQFQSQTEPSCQCLQLCGAELINVELTPSEHPRDHLFEDDHLRCPFLVVPHLVEQIGEQRLEINLAVLLEEVS
jgi:hypothetical protein